LSSPETPSLARPGLDRAAHRRRDEEWLAQAWQRARVLVVAEGRVLLSGGRLVLLTPEQASAFIDAPRYFLGVDGEGVPYFAVVAELPTVEGARSAGVREIGHLLDELEAGLLMTAVALANWHASHGFSPGSGGPTVSREGGWVRADEAGTPLFPRTDPAVIVLVHDGVPAPEGRCLLGHNAAWTRLSPPGAVRRYSCLAGFVEPGESAEQTVVREVTEEVGVHVSELRYVASQAWPYPGSLMLGFTARADPAEPFRLDPDEIADARWFTRAEILAALDPDRTDLDFGLPPASSIAHFLISGWADGRH
jgi:NAD+ diphosphatase